MGLLSYLKRKISALLQPWLVHKDSVLDILSIHILFFSQVVLELMPTELDCNVINSCLDSCPFLLQRIHFDRVKVIISLFRSPGILLEVHGLRIVGHPRFSEDGFWSAKYEQSIKDGKREAVFGLDPQGAAIHKAAESHIKDISKISYSRTILLGFVLHALQLKFIGASLMLQSNDVEKCTSHSIVLESLVVEEDHGLAKALLAIFVNMLRHVEGSFKKVCLIKGLGLQLMPCKDGASEEQSSEVHSPGFYVLLWKNASLFSEFQNNQLLAMEAIFPETMFQMSSSNIEALHEVYNQLQGLPLTNSKGDHNRKSKPGLHLWQNAMEKVAKRSRRRLKYAVNAAVLRDKYVRLYTIWLLKSGVGQFDDLTVLNKNEEFKVERMDPRHLQCELSCIEDKLPIESIVLARALARRKVLTVNEEKGFTNKKVLFLYIFRRASGALAVFYNQVLCLLHVFIKSIILLTLKSREWVAALRYMFWSGYRGRQIKVVPDQIKGDGSKFLSKQKLRAGSKKGTSQFSCTFNTGSLILTTPIDKSMVTARKSLKKTMNEENMECILFTWTNISVSNVLSSSGQQLELICDRLEAELVSSSFGNAKYGKSWDLKEKGDSVKFLLSGPAPRLPFPEKARDEYKQASCMGGLPHNNDSKICPFLFIHIELPNADTIHSGQEMDLTSCELALGCLDLKFDMNTLNNLGFILMDVLTAVNSNGQNTGHTSICKATFWESLHNQLKQSVSAIVFKRPVKVSAAVAGPKLQLYIPFIDSQGTYISIENNIRKGKGSTLVVSTGIWGAAVWPATVNKDIVSLGDPGPSSNKDIEKMCWLRIPPKPLVSLEMIFKDNPEHEQIGTNAICFIEGTMIQVSNDSEVYVMAGPVNMVSEFSLCRDHLVSPFGINDIVSAAVLFSVKVIPLAIDTGNLNKLSEVSKAVSTLAAQISGYKCQNNFVQTKKIPEKSFGLCSTLIHSESLYFAVWFKIQLEGLKYYVSCDHKTQTGIKITDDGVIKEKQIKAFHERLLDAQDQNLFKTLDVEGKTMNILFKELWLELSWGDGCMLAVSSGFMDASLYIATVGHNSINESLDACLSSNLSIKHLFCTVKRPWCPFGTSDKSLQQPHMHVRESGQIQLQNRERCIIGTLQVSKFHLIESAFTKQVNNVLCDIDATPDLSMEVSMSNDSQSVSLVSQGGLVIIQMRALSEIIQEGRNIYCIGNLLKECTTVDNVVNSYTDKVKASTDANLSLEKSSSLPLQQSHNQRLKHRQNSVPVDLNVQEAEIKQCPWLIGEYVFDISRVSLLLVESEIVSSDIAGLLLEVDGVSKIQSSPIGLSMNIEVRELSLRTVKLSSEYSGPSNVESTPKFGPIQILTKSSGAKEVKSLLDEDLTGEINLESDDCHTKTSLVQSNQLNQLQKFHPERENDYILERLGISCRLENTSDHAALSHDWKGSCSFFGFDIRITTMEVQIILALTSSLSAMSLTDSQSDWPTVSKHVRDIRGPFLDYEYKIPDESIVVVKDVQEHLYMAVEKTENNYRLVGVLHYSLVGERALFKVQYQKKHAQSSGAWFSLLSLGAKNNDGVPFRVHYNPGSGLADISSTNDGSWELWQTLSYKDFNKDHDGDMDIGDMYCNLVYLINQKSKQGLTLSDGAPMLVKRPGNPFKISVVRSVTVDKPLYNTNLRSSQESKHIQDMSLVSLPKVDIEIGTMSFVLMYETGGGKHLLPLLRGRIENMGAVMHVQQSKVRLMGQCKIIFEYLEAHADKWSMIMQPLDTEIFYRSRLPPETGCETRKMATSLFARLKRVDITISERSLDMILFVIGLLDIAGPFTVKYSPVLATSCLVENRTGLSLCCSFHSKDEEEVLKIPALKRKPFLIRSMTSRKHEYPVKVSSSVLLYLEKDDNAFSSRVSISLEEPGVTAIRTHLESKEGHRRVTGPIIVVDVSSQSQDGILVTVSPMTRIHNASGLKLELRCRRPNMDSEGAVVLLDHDKVIDDSMGAFDAITLEGELRKTMASFNVGNYLLSIRPADEDITYNWSEDIKGAKPVRISKFLDKLHYGLRKDKPNSHVFGTVHCGISSSGKDDYDKTECIQGLHLFVRKTSRRVPVISTKAREKKAWQEQQELVILPTMRVYNLLKSRISLIVGSNLTGESQEQNKSRDMLIESGAVASMYVDLADPMFAVRTEGDALLSSYVNIGDWKRSYDQFSSTADGFKDVELDLDFRDNCHYAKIKISRADDGVLQMIIYAEYALKNNSATALVYCAPKRRTFFWSGISPWTKSSTMQWPSGQNGIIVQPGSTLSILERPSCLIFRTADRSSETAGLDLDSLSGSTELSVDKFGDDGMIHQIPLGIKMSISESEIDPTRTILICSRYIMWNDSQEPILVCQDGFQEDDSAAHLLKSGEQVSFTRRLPKHAKTRTPENTNYRGFDTSDSSVCYLRFRFQENGWNWTGPVCASALGSFSLRNLRRSVPSESQYKADNEIISKSVASESQSRNDNEVIYKFLSIHVEELSPSLVVRFNTQSPDTVPFRIENALSKAPILFYQKGLGDSAMKLLPGEVTGYAWDDLSQPHRLVVSVSGTQLCAEINLAKLKSWRSFRPVRQNRNLALQIPLQNQLDAVGERDSKGMEVPMGLDLANIGYEVCADGLQRVLRVCGDRNSTKANEWLSHVSQPSGRMHFKLLDLRLTLSEYEKQVNEEVKSETVDVVNELAPIISIRISNLLAEIVDTQKNKLLQLKVQTLSVDEKWKGAPFAAMLRVHSSDHFKKGGTVLHMAAIISNQPSHLIHVKYSSVLLQVIDLNIDEETLMKLVPFLRYSLSQSTSSSQFYFERFEIHPIKIVASFLPGHPHADYTSAQETLRALLHSFIKVPTIRATTVQLNGVLLSHALLNFRQLAIKCAQHYSWYAMRAIYIAKGSKYLPPAFASLFDDSAASSLDVFFDPSIGSIDLQGLTLGMFNLLSEGLSKRGFSGTSRYVGDLEKMMKTAGSNILFAILTEISDNVLKGAETGGLDGMVNGFRRGILNVSMDPSLLRSAVVKGGSSRRIKLDRSAGTDELYIEGYLQAMLDTSFKQDYLRVRVIDDQVLLKNLPPNSTLVDEIMEMIKSFLIREGLLAGQTSSSTIHSLRRLDGENDKRIIPAVFSLCEQLFVIFSVRTLRNHTRSLLPWGSIIMRNQQTRSNQETNVDRPNVDEQRDNKSVKSMMFSFVLSGAMAYIDGRLCRHIPNALVRRVVSGFLLSFVE